MLRKVNEGLDELELFTDLGARSIAASETEDKDWINNWKQYFKPFTVDNILIKPTWETIPEEHKDKLLVQIDPGTAFGTGMHETTQLCIRQLEKHVHSEAKILDVGTGSGILGITALKLGAKEVWRIWRLTAFQMNVSMYFREILLTIPQSRTGPDMENTTSQWRISLQM